MLCLCLWLVVVLETSTTYDLLVLTSILEYSVVTVGCIIASTIGSESVSLSRYVFALGVVIVCTAMYAPQLEQNPGTNQVIQFAIPTLIGALAYTCQYWVECAISKIILVSGPQSILNKDVSVFLLGYENSSLKGRVSKVHFCTVELIEHKTNTKLYIPTTYLLKQCVLGQGDFSQARRQS